MIDNLKGQEKLEVEKIKVTEAEIVVRGTIDKPYYVIVYHEVGKDYNNEGFGSYRLKNVFKWRDERFEKVDKNQPKTDWIPCEVDMPKELGRYIVTLKDGRSLEAIYDNISKRFIMYEHEVIAWQPLPAPYKKEGAE